MSLITEFTFDRNTILRTPEISAGAAYDSIQKVISQAPLDKTESNKAAAYSSFLGLFYKTAGNYQVTALARQYLTLYTQNKVDAWQWLLTRSLCLYNIPNGTNSKINRSIPPGQNFNIFRLLIKILTHLQTLSKEQRFFYFDEFLQIFQTDSNWFLDSSTIFAQIIQLRNSSSFIPNTKRALLGDLEDAYNIPRDNMNGYFNKILEHTGLFEYYVTNSKNIGIALRTDLDEILQKRIRFVIDNDKDWNSSQKWIDYLNDPSIDFPFEVSQTPSTILQTTSPPELRDLINDAKNAFDLGGFKITTALLTRYVASLLTKRFVILSGLTGSGKTKLAHLLALWLDDSTSLMSNYFPLNKILDTGHTKYEIVGSTEHSIELKEKSERITTLPVPLIMEWVKVIKDNNFSDSTTAETIRDTAQLNSIYSNFIHGYSSQLKALAFHYIEEEHVLHNNKRFSIIPVEANWGSTEDILGYPDGLNNERFVRREALNVILNARENFLSSATTQPYFLILDEMNLSHVEKYFALILSTIESGEFLSLHSDSRDKTGVPKQLSLPPNLFIVGTINVDETTYQFSPKVLDRANVIEFRVDDKQMADYLNQPSDIDVAKIQRKGSAYAKKIIESLDLPINLSTIEKQLLSDELNILYTLLSKEGVEFGFRTAKEIRRFLYFHKLLCETTWKFSDALDAQIFQKILPKLHGSQRKLEPLLRGLAFYCFEERKWQTESEQTKQDIEKTKFSEKMMKATDLRSRFQSLESESQRNQDNSNATAYLPLSYEKVCRMLDRLERDGFTSFSEA